MEYHHLRACYASSGVGHALLCKYQEVFKVCSRQAGIRTSCGYREKLKGEGRPERGHLFRGICRGGTVRADPRQRLPRNGTEGVNSDILTGEPAGAGYDGLDSEGQ